MPFRTLLILLILLGFLPGGAAPAQEPEDDRGGTIQLESDQNSDRAIVRRVRSIFEQLPGFEQVEVSAASGVVTLQGEVADAQSAAEAERLAARIEGVVAVRNEVALEASIEKRVAPALRRLEERLKAALGLAPLAVLGLLVFAIIALLGLWLASLQRPWQRVAPNSFVADLVRQVIRLTFVAVGLVVALDIVGATALLGTILGAAGILGLAIGFALRDTIENYVSSIMLSVRQPFRPNDLVRIEEHEGHIIRLTSRATVLMSLDGNHVRIPNAAVFKGVIVNYTRNPERRFEFTIGVAADYSLKHAVEVGTAALKDLDFVLETPEPVSAVQEVGASNVLLWFAGWIDQRTTDFVKARGEAIRLTKRALEEAGVPLPEPIYRVRLDRSDALGRAAGPAAKAAAPLEPRAESPLVGDASKESAVAEKVAAERSTQRERDLLDPSAPSE